jgi:hypothetical protein
MACIFILNEDKPLSKYKLPKPLFEITISENFNQSLEDLPETIEIITFSGKYGLITVNSIPNTVKKLIFNLLWHKLDNLPCSIEVIQMNNPIFRFDFLAPNKNNFKQQLKNIYNIIEKNVSKIPFDCIVINSNNEIIYR